MGPLAGRDRLRQRQKKIKGKMNGKPARGTIVKLHHDERTLTPLMMELISDFHKTSPPIWAVVVDRGHGWRVVDSSLCEYDARELARIEKRPGVRAGVRNDKSLTITEI